jgi:hypothetical protein
MGMPALTVVRCGGPRSGARGASIQGDQRRPIGFLTSADAAGKPPMSDLP